MSLRHRNEHSIADAGSIREHTQAFPRKTSSSASGSERSQLVPASHDKQARRSRARSSDLTGSRNRSGSAASQQSNSTVRHDDAVQWPEGALPKHESAMPVVVSPSEPEASPCTGVQVQPIKCAPRSACTACAVWQSMHYICNPRDAK